MMKSVKKMYAKTVLTAVMGLMVFAFAVPCQVGSNADYNGSYTFYRESGMIGLQVVYRF